MSSARAGPSGEGVPRTAPEIIWKPTAEAAERSRMGRWLRWLARERQLAFASYDEAWAWSVDDLGGFWSSVWDHFDVRSTTWPGAPLKDAVMPGARWFGGARLNYAEHALRLGDHSGDDVVVVGVSQTRDRVELRVDDLRDQVARARAGLRRLGVRTGDRVVGYVPNIPEALIAFLATASLGATWSSCAPELGVRAVIDRLGQLDPTVLVTVGGYRHGTRVIDRRAQVADVRRALPSLAATVEVPYLHAGGEGIDGVMSWGELTAEAGDLDHEPVPFDHPLFVLYSSGTTGPPKAIVHGHGGILLEHLRHWVSIPTWAPRTASCGTRRRAG
jgi:acetoacetyl-CoA synthetase